jgi:transcriptional antiterminator NusG
MNNWCVLFVKTGAEERLLKRVISSVEVSLISPFIIKKEKYFRKSSGVEEGIRKNICFPGYLFIETDLPTKKLVESIQEVIQHTKGIYRILSYTNTKDIFIHEHELSMLKTLCDEAACIKNSTGIIIGDKIQIKSGPLIGMESMIKKIDRHERNATIELHLLGGIYNITIALEIIAKI